MQKRQLNLIIVFLCFCVLLTACGKSNEGNLQTDKPQNESHTLLIYMCGSDLESSRGYASNNIEEILGAEIPENINVILQTGGSENWHTTGISAEHIGRYEIKNGQLTQLSVLPQSKQVLGASVVASTQLCLSASTASSTYESPHVAQVYVVYPSSSQVGAVTEVL